MQLRIPLAALVAASLIAAAPAPQPVITVGGLATAARLDAPVRKAIAGHVASLNTGLVKFVAAYRALGSATAADSTRIERDIMAIHLQCKADHDAIVKELDPAQQQAYFQYLHAQLKAAGVDVTQMQQMMMGDSAHAKRHGG